MTAGARVGFGCDTEMEGPEPTGTYLMRLAQSSLDLVEARCRALLRERPTEMDLSPGVPECERHLLGKTERFTRGRLDMLGPTQPNVHECCPIA